MNCKNMKSESNRRGKWRWGKVFKKIIQERNESPGLSEHT
jgi:hypothetical protein